MLKLKDICEVDWGNTSLTKKAYETDGKYLAVSAAGCDGKISFYEHDPSVCVLSAIGAQCGRMFYPQTYFTAIKNTITLKPNEEVVHSKFLYYLFSHINLPKRGSAQPFISIGDVKKFPLPYLPSLAEQKRIVERLDKAFAEIDKILGKTESILLDIPALRIVAYASVIEKLSSGEQSYHLEDLVTEDCKLSYGIVQPGDDVNNGIPIVRPVDMSGKAIDFQSLKRIDPKRAKGYSRTSLRGDELLMSVRGSTGSVSYSNKHLVGCNVTRGIIPIRFNEKIVQKDFGYYLLLSLFVQKQIKDATYGAALQQINVKDVKSLVLKIPPLIDQFRIIKTLQEIDKVLDLLHRAKSTKRKDVKLLKASILKEELTPSEAV